MFYVFKYLFHSIEFGFVTLRFKKIGYYNLLDIYIYNNDFQGLYTS